MGKKRKTRQEKIISDLRRKLQTQLPIPKDEATMSIQPIPKATAALDTYTLPQVQMPSRPSPMNREPRTHNYAYVVSDLKKTLLLTSIAIAVQIGLYLIVVR